MASTNKQFLKNKDIVDFWKYIFVSATYSFSVIQVVDVST